MTPAQSTATNRLSKRRSYRRLMYGFLAGGVIAGLGLRFLDYPLAGELVYWLGVLGFFAVWVATPVKIFDERDAALERRASQLTLYVFGAVLVVGASAARVLPRVADVTVPPAVSGALYGYVALFVVYGLFCLGLRYRI